MKTKTLGRTSLCLGAACALALALCGCTGTIFAEEDGGTRKDQFLVKSLALSGTTQDDCAIEVEEVADSDGSADQKWQVDFALNGADAAGSLPVDTGEEKRYILGVKATRSSDGEVFYKRVTVTLYD